MTAEELDQKHLEVSKCMIEAEVPLNLESSAHAKISIEYAISVLEEIRDNASANQFYYEDDVKGKIKELQSLLK
jgi:hypothetical protein